MVNEKGVALNNKIEAMVLAEVKKLGNCLIDIVDGYEMDSIDLEALRSEITEVIDVFSLEGTPEVMIDESWHIANWKVEEVCGKYQLDIKIEREYFVD